MRKQEIKINGSVFVETDRLILRMIQETDKEKYVTLSYENSIMKSFFKDEQFIDDLWSTYYSDVYCAGHDDDFSKQENIDSDDYNYGWKLGEFCVSGYSSHVTDGEGNYVFLKNAGDKITLSFILEQKDIHCLDGKSELYIRELSSRDEYFQTQKLDFGHGAMILRYTDSENKKHDPEIYTNYLEALEVGNENMISVEGPDTTSYLLEEGDYEVALDYRVAKEKNGPLFINPKDKYQDYRIFFKFSIRNGNCMSFIRDVTTGNELTNENVTKDGFIVDMANSKYLQVNIKKEVLSKGKNGLVEDTRFNKPVSDGEKFTDEGVYTLTTKNVYTEQTTVKRIYVGSNKVMITCHMRFRSKMRLIRGCWFRFITMESSIRQIIRNCIRCGGNMTTGD